MIQKSSGKFKPSSDTLTHLEIYKNFKKVKSIVHTFKIRSCLVSIK